MYINYAKYVVTLPWGGHLGQPVKYDHNPTRRVWRCRGGRRKGFPWGRAPLIWHRCCVVMTGNTSARRIWKDRLNMGVMGKANRAMLPAMPIPILERIH